MPKRTRFARDVDCPTCGATPSHQRWKPRKMVASMTSRASAIAILSMPFIAVAATWYFAYRTSSTTTHTSLAGTR